MNDPQRMIPFVPKRAVADALAALDALRTQDRLVRSLIRPELEPVTLSGLQGT